MAYWKSIFESAEQGEAVYNEVYNTFKDFLPFDMDRPMGQVRRLDERINDAGYLRLMPTEPLAMNMRSFLSSAGACILKENDCGLCIAVSHQSMKLLSCHL